MQSVLLRCYRHHQQPLRSDDSSPPWQHESDSRGSPGSSSPHQQRTLMSDAPGKAEDDGGECNTSSEEEQLM